MECAIIYVHHKKGRRSDIKVEIIAHTPDPEKVVAMAAKLCYSSKHIDEIDESLDSDAVFKFIEKLSDLGHESPLEHISFTFGVEGVSRALLAQITRHRIASFSVQSQRYVTVNNFDYVIPPEIEQDAESKETFFEAMSDAYNAYNKLHSRLTHIYKERLVADGVSSAKAHADAKKKANEDARFVLPNACETRMVFTMNARELLHFFSLRCCNRAQWEIRALADEMLRQVKEICPAIFKNAGPGCVRGKCSEGAMSCGSPRRVSS